MIKPLHIQDSTDIPAHLKGMLDDWVANGYYPGSALGAMLTNDLRNFFGHADAELLANSAAVFKYIYNRMPIGCWGSSERMNKWQESFTKKEL